MTYLRGVDVSAHQTTTPDLTGLDFLFARATIAMRTDPMYPVHTAAARKAGLVTGAYHFNWSTLPVIDQADLFLATARDADLLALDVELNDDRHGTVTPAFTPAQAAQFIDRIHRAGRTIGLYHSQSGFFDAGQDWNWIANRRTTPPPAPWAFWQYRGTPLDLDYFAGTRADLDRLKGAPMAYTKLAGPPLGTVTINGTGHALIGTGDTIRERYPNRPAGEPLTVLAVVNLVDKAGKPIDIDGHQPPVAGRDQVYLVDKPEFGAAAYALRADCTPLVPAVNAVAERQAGYDYAVKGASVQTPKVTFPPRPS